MAGTGPCPKQSVLGVGGGDRDHICIGGGIERRRFRSGIADGGDHHNALRDCGGDTAFDQRILRTGEAHIDDLRAVRRCVIQSLQDHVRGAFAPFGAAPEARIAKIRAAGALPISRACDTIAPAMPVPWTCGPSLLPSASKLSEMVLASSGCLASMPESITAIVPFIPR